MVDENTYRTSIGEPHLGRPYIEDIHLPGPLTDAIPRPFSYCLGL